MVSIYYDKLLLYFTSQPQSIEEESYYAHWKKAQIFLHCKPAIFPHKSYLKQIL